MKDFLQAIFSRGSQNNTFDPLVMVGGVDYTSASLTTEVAHFSGGAMLVSVVGASGTQSVSGNVRIFDSSGNSIIATNTSPALTEQGVVTRPLPPTTILSTFISVSGTTGSVVVQNTNGSRQLAVANNDSTAVMYLNYGVAAGTQTYFVRIPSLGYWEMPQPIWQGSLAVIWDTTNTGAGRFTILT